MRAFKGTNQRCRKPARRKKKPPRGELTAAEKRANHKLARIRVRVEHAIAGVKRCRIVKDVFRNTQEGVSDSVMEAASGLHNLRVQSRKRGRRRVFRVRTSHANRIPYNRRYDTKQPHF